MSKSVGHKMVHAANVATAAGVLLQTAFIATDLSTRVARQIRKSWRSRKKGGKDPAAAK